MNKYITYFALLFLVTPGLLGAQGTCTISNPSADFCTQCNSGGASDIVDANGVISGTLTLNFPSSTGGTLTIPADCGGTTLSLGALTINIPNKNNLVIDPAVGVDPTATSFMVNGTSGNPSITESGVVYTRNGIAGADFAALVANIRAKATALPVSLSAWNALPGLNGILIEWVSVSERDNDFYEVEHSTDGVNFTSLTKLMGLSESVTEVNYAYLHEKPAAGTHYYRLSQQDLDGTRTNFGIRSVSIDSEDRFSLLFPNPVLSGGEITLRMPQDAPSSVAVLYSTVGKLVATYALGQGTRSFQLPAGLAPGIYLLRTNKQTTRLLIK